jgi:peptidylprolyl isomerase
MRNRLLPLLSLLAVGTLAACGSNNADTEHIIPAPSAAQTLPPPKTKPATASTTPATGATAASVSVPSKGPLSVEPKISVPSTSAPKTLVKKNIIVGTGTEAKAEDELTVDYVGALYKNGKIFDASWSHGGPKGQPFQFELGVGDVIPGWDKGVVGMRVGGRRELIIPASLGYGAAGSGSTIPPNSALIFIVDLLAVSPASG